MQHRILSLDEDFEVVFGNEQSQAAQMTLAPGTIEGDAGNRHQGADQWLFVVEGTGTAIVEGQSIPLRRGSILLMGRGETHEIRNSGTEPLRTLNIYVPPAYSQEGNPLPAGQPG